MNLSMSDIRELLCLPSPLPVATCQAPPCPRRQIVIGERGWVFVGTVERDGGDYILKDAGVIRVWGTTEGLPELARNGKTAKTIIDQCGTIRVPELAVIARIDVESGVNL